MAQPNESLRRSARIQSRNQNRNNSQNQNHNHNQQNILPPEILEEELIADEPNPVENVEPEPVDEQQLVERFPRRQLAAIEPVLNDEEPIANDGDNDGDNDGKEEHKVDRRTLPQQQRGHALPSEYIPDNIQRRNKWKNFRARYHNGFQTMCLQTKCSGVLSYWNVEEIGLQPRQEIYLSPDYEYGMMEDINQLTQWMLELQQTTLAARIRARIPINIALAAANDQPLNEEENNLAHDGNNTLDPESARRALRNSTADILQRSFEINVFLGCIFENIVADRFNSSSRAFVYNELAIAPPQLPPQLDRNDDSIAPMPVIDPLSRFELNIINNAEPNVAVQPDAPNQNDAPNQPEDEQGPNAEQQQNDEVDGN